MNVTLETPLEPLYVCVLTLETPENQCVCVFSLETFRGVGSFFGNPLEMCVCAFIVETQTSMCELELDPLTLETRTKKLTKNQNLLTKIQNLGVWKLELKKETRTFYLGN
jgi:hypothetical protein